MQKLEVDTPLKRDPYKYVDDKAVIPLKEDASMEDVIKTINNIIGYCKLDAEMWNLHIAEHRMRNSIFGYRWGD